MRHPRITQWTDFARALADAEERSALQRHLDAGCLSCRAIVASLQQLTTTAEIDGALYPPAGVVRSVNAFFGLQQAGAAAAAKESLQPSFDSALVPMRAARSAASATRQLLFESGDYTVELSLDHSVDAPEVLLRGQILEADGEPRSHAPVFLIGGGEVRGRAISAQHGTFELSSRLEPHCELWLFPDDDSRIRLDLTPDH